MAAPIIELRSPWMEREQGKFDSGEYTPVLWHEEKWWQDSEFYHIHFAHVALKDATKLAFTESAVKGELDRQLVVRPGKYLKRYFSHVLTAEQIRDYATQWAAVNEELSYKIATEPDDIEYVYDNGPSSCMHGHSAPRVYGAGDLGIAYLIDDCDDITARVLCWPEKKIYGRIYGDAERLKSALEQDGFHMDNGNEFEGARMLREDGPHYGTSVCPSIDLGYGVNIVSHDRMVMSKRCEFSSTDAGYIGGEECGRCGENFCSEDEGGYDNSNGYHICQSCLEYHYMWCTACEEYCDSDEGVSTGDSWYCEHCKDDHVCECIKCGDEGTPKDDVEHDKNDEPVCRTCFENWYHSCVECATAVEDDEVIHANGTDAYCPDCFEGEDGAYCSDCGDAFTDDLTVKDGEPYCEDCYEEEDEDE